MTVWQLQMHGWVSIEIIHNELAYMTDLTEFVFSQVQKPESLSCARGTLLMYYLMWCSRVFSVFKGSVQSC